MPPSPVQLPRQPGKPTGSPPPESSHASNDPLKKAEEIKNKVMQSLEPENMSVPAKRLIAGFIDLTLIGCLVAFMHVPLMVLLAVLPGFLVTLVSTLIVTLGGVLILLKDAPYQIAVLDKQSIGKKVMNLRVVKGPDRQPITTADSVARNFLLAVPYFVAAALSLLNLLPFRILVGVIVMVLAAFLLILVLALYGFEIFTMFKDLEGRRWGDQKAGTMVVLE